jgi:hypothetical protein
MNEESLHTDLDALTEETARKIIWTLQPGATSGDPLPTIKQLLYNFLDAAREQEYQETLRQQLRKSKISKINRAVNIRLCEKQGRFFSSQKL